jgi:hypothetical protein
MGLLIADAVVLAAVVFATRRAAARPARVTPLVLALVAATLFILIRNQYDLEDSAFLWGLLAVSASASVASAGIALTTRQGARDSFIFGVLAGVLVPLLFVAYLALRLTICLITDCDLS